MFVRVQMIFEIDRNLQRPTLSPKTCAIVLAERQLNGKLFCETRISIFIVPN